LKLSNAAASLILVLVLFGLAIYVLVAPPAGYEDNFVHRLVLPLLLVATALGVLENLRTRSHINQLIGALRGMMKKAGTPASPQVKGEAIEILLASLRSDRPTVRKTAAVQLRNLTGQELGEDAEAWERWWAGHRDEYRPPGS